MNLWLLNVFFVIVNGFFAYSEFKNGSKKWAWFNLFASALNFGVVLDNVL